MKKRELNIIYVACTGTAREEPGLQLLVPARRRKYTILRFRNEGRDTQMALESSGKSEKNLNRLIFDLACLLLK
jgi:hypothetical protein